MITSDDPRLTAHLLGESLSAADQAEITLLLRSHPELGFEMEETMRLVSSLRGELLSEAAAAGALSEAQRQAVLAAAGGTVAINGAVAAATVLRFPWWRQSWVPSSIAACVLVGTTLLVLNQTVLERSPLQVPEDGAEMRVDLLPPNPQENVPFAGIQVAPGAAAPLGMAEGQLRSPAVPLETALKLQLPAPAQVPSLPEVRLDTLVAAQDSTSRARTEQPVRDKSKDLYAMVPKEGSVKTYAPEQVAPVDAAAAPKTPRAAALSALPGSMMGRSGGAPRDATELAGILPLRSETVPKEELPSDPAPRARPPLAQVEQSNTESYDAIVENPFLTVRENPLSTFAADVDTASYANVRRFLTQGQRPPPGAVRIEELVNYFPYAYPPPQGADPFATHLEIAACPWAPTHRLLRVGIAGKQIARADRPAANLVFLVDVSGSMQPANRLPLVKECLHQLVAQLEERDTVAIVVYAGASGTVLEPTGDRAAIRAALDRLDAGGSTNGASGIRLAYDVAARAFKKEGINRVILATDGDFNVGVTNQSELVSLIEEKARTKVFLSVLGFGLGNLKDSTMEKLANRGNGNYAYIDTLAEGRKVLVEQMAGTLMTIAKDVKFQVEWNPAHVASYRLIGYENRLLRKEDFNDDKKDAGEIGAGHTVTALYEVVPAGAAVVPGVDSLKYQAASPAPAGASPEMLTLKLRWKAPEGDESTLRDFPLTDGGLDWARSSREFRWAAAVAGFGMLLRDSPHRGSLTWDAVRELAVEGKGEDALGYRAEFLGLIDKARGLVK